MNRARTYNEISVLRSIVLFLVIVFIVSSCVRDSDFPIGKTVVCDTETINSNGDKFVGNNSDELFNGGYTRTKLEAHSGDYSALTIPEKQAYALTYEINRIEPNAFLEVSVWRKSKNGEGSLAVAAEKTYELFKVVNKATITTNDGWERIDIDVYTPPNFSGGKLKIHVWNNGTDTVYFDDLTITRKKFKTYPDFDYENGLNLVIDTSDYIKLMDKRKDAFDNSILQVSDEDWIKGIVIDKNVAMKAKMRLKGDWLDHLWGYKWSFRVKLRKQNTFNRMTIFSLQTPLARNYLLEWLTHKLYHRFDVLTTRYGFIPLSINDMPRGLYVWEEHFAKQLPEWNNRREGPIVKFSEEPFWQVLKQNIKRKDWPNLPYYQASVIEPFGQSKTMSNPTLYAQFLIAQKLMEQYKYQTKQTHEIFDVDKLSRYFALLDLTHARHGMTWHNQRMYYNPVICKLEPIAFDGYTDHSNPELTIKDNMAFKAYSCNEPMIPQNRLILRIFADTIFLNKYLNYLEEYSVEQTINDFIDTQKNDIQYYDSLLLMEFPNYHYDDDFLLQSAAGIRNYLPELKKLISDRLAQGPLIIEKEEEFFNDSILFENTPELFVTAHVEDRDTGGISLGVNNYFTREIKLLGSGIDDKLITNFFKDPIILDPYQEAGASTKVEVDTIATSLFFTVDRCEDIFKISILPWQYPEGITPQQELWDKIDLNHPVFERITGKNIYIKTGKTTVNQPIIIPDGYVVNFKKGTEIDLIDSAMIISYSPVSMIGTGKNPIIIGSSDFTGNGITVLQASDISNIENVIFENLNTLNYNRWTLTGAVTFYESDVRIKNTKFIRNQCEDALNIIRSKFIVENTKFDYIFGDAFDADFCSGTISKSNFSNIGNDAMDFSGSKITILDTEVIGANDKGVSGGEESEIMVINTLISRANIGLASKDLSVVKVIDSQIESCNYGALLLQKKPEFGPSVMIFENSVIIDSKTDMLIELGSKIILDGKTIEGKEENLSAKFY